MTCKLGSADGGRKAGAKRVVRGGSWNNKARNVRCACRNQNPPDNRNNNLGFRPARAHDWTGRSGPEQTVVPAALDNAAKQIGPDVLVAQGGCPAKTHRWVALSSGAVKAN